MREVLSDDDLQSLLADLPRWRRVGPKLVREAEFAAYLDGLRFVEGVAQEAERRDHHPDLTLGYRRVKIELTSHDAGGITRRDADLARWIEARLSRSA